MTNLAAQAAGTLAASASQQIGVAVARQQIAAERAVAGLVAGAILPAAPPAPPGQGRIVDLRA
jgi:hypothetical protein